MHTHPPARTAAASPCGRPTFCPPEGGSNERASSEGGAVHRRRCLHLWRLRGVRRLSTDGQTRRTNSGRKEGKGCMRRGGSGDGQRSKEPPPALLRSAGMVASRPRFNRRNGPNQRGDGSGIFSFPAAITSGYARGHSMEGIMCMRMWIAVQCMHEPTSSATALRARPTNDRNDHPTAQHKT